VAPGDAGLLLWLLMGRLQQCMVTRLLLPLLWLVMVLLLLPLVCSACGLVLLVLLFLPLMLLLAGLLLLLLLGGTAFSKVD
jgi:hypothetical protein